MKKPIIIATLLLLAVASSGQDKVRQTPEERAKAHTERMTKQLELTAEQAAQVEAVNLRFAKELEAKRAAREAERDARKAEAQAMRDEHDAEMKAILNSNQYVRWQTMRAEALDRHREHRERRREGK